MIGQLALLSGGKDPLGLPFPSQPCAARSTDSGEEGKSESGMSGLTDGPDFSTTIRELVWSAPHTRGHAVAL